MIFNIFCLFLIIERQKRRSPVDETTIYVCLILLFRPRPIQINNIHSVENQASIKHDQKSKSSFNSPQSFKLRFAKNLRCFLYCAKNSYCWQLENAQKSGRVLEICARVQIRD